MKKTPSAFDVASWMLAEVKREDTLYQETAAYEILERFGEEFTYYNANGNIAIGKDVLAAFLVLSEEDVVWIKSQRYWRLRTADDAPGREQKS